MWTGVPQCILLLGTNRHSPALLRAGPISHPRCPLLSEVSWYAGLYLVSAASLPHHLEATHLVFRPTLAEPKHFLMVTQPPRRAEGREKEKERINWEKRERKSATEWTHHGIFPYFSSSSALVWNDSYPAVHKERSFARALHRTLSLFLTPQPINSIGKHFFSVNCKDLWAMTQTILTVPTCLISLLIVWLVDIIKLLLLCHWFLLRVSCHWCLSRFVY